MNFLFSLFFIIFVLNERSIKRLGLKKKEIMSNNMENKQSSVERFWEQLEEKSWENASMNRIEISISVEEYLALKNQAKAMHQEEISQAYGEGYSQGYAQCEEAEDYYYERR